MRWEAVDFDWTQVRAFVATQDSGSISAAARALRISQPTVSRQIAALETHLSVTLFERTGRRVLLTDAGRALLPHARAMVEAANQLALTASGQATNLSGPVAVSAGDLFAAHLLPPLVQSIRATAPGVRIEVIADNAVADLLHREADIAVRHLRPSQPDLMARKIAETPARLYGARSYLARVGTPKTLDDLRRHDFVSFSEDTDMLGHLTAFGLPVSADQFSARSDNGVTGWEMVRQGLGLAVMADIFAARDPMVVPVLPDHPPITFPVWLVTHRELHTSPRIRLVFDLLASGIARALAGHSGEPQA